MEYLANNSDAVRMDLACSFVTLILEACLRLTAQLRPFFAGLTYLHSQSIVHGNIKSV
jgi:hypothetical protein